MVNVNEWENHIEILEEFSQEQMAEYNQIVSENYNSRINVYISQWGEVGAMAEAQMLEEEQVSASYEVWASSQN